MKRLASLFLALALCVPELVILSTPAPAEAARRKVVRGRRTKVIINNRGRRRGRKKAIIVAPNSGRPVRVIVR